MEDILIDGARNLGITLPETAAEKLKTYAALLTERNSVMNLTAITGEEDIARLHFLDSLALLNYADFPGMSVADIGTGAGFPGLPLKLAVPDVKLTLIDSQRKRVDFLAEVCRELGTDGAACIHARAEEIPAGLREDFDIVLSRAVSRLNILCELCLPYVKPGGVMLAMKGPEPEDEIAEAESAAAVLGGRYESTFAYTIPGTDVRHTVIVISKVSETPEKYPRRFVRMQKTPL